MWTQPNGEPMCLCRLDVRNWNCSLPAEVWPKVESDKSLKLADLTQHIEAGVVSAFNPKRTPTVQFLQAELRGVEVQLVLECPRCCSTST